MKKLVLEIFDKVNTDIPSLSEMEKDLAWQAETILEAIKEQIPQEHHEDIDRRLCEMSGIAARKGFELGAKYMVRLLAECLS